MLHGASIPICTCTRMNGGDPFNLQSYVQHRKRVRDIMIDEGMVIGRDESGGGHGPRVGDSHNIGNDDSAAVHLGSRLDAGTADGRDRMFVHVDDGSPHALRTGALPGLSDVAGMAMRAAGSVAAAVVGTDQYERARSEAERYMSMKSEASTMPLWAKLGRVLRKFDRSFTLFEMDGVFNLDTLDNAWGLSSYNAANQDPVFSVGYVQSLRSPKHFIRIGLDLYLSTAALIDLCRCPAFLSMSNASRAVLMNRIFRHSRDRTSDIVFGQWLEKNASSYGEDQEYALLSRMFEHAQLLFRGVTRLRSAFAIADEVADKGTVHALDVYFNMEYDVWVKTVLQEHYRVDDSAHVSDDIASIVKKLAPYNAASELVHAYERHNTVELRSEQAADVQSRQLDLFYANLVHGAAVRVPLSDIWCPNNEMDHSEADSEQFFTVMWNSLKGVISASLQGQVSLLAINPSSSSSNVSQRDQQTVKINAADFMDKLAKSIRRIKDTKRIMKEIWEASKDYRISDRVHMTEVQILQRLHADGVFPYVDRARERHRDRGGFFSLQLPTASGSSGSTASGIDMQNAHVCFYMRR